MMRRAAFKGELSIALIITVVVTLVVALVAIGVVLIPHEKIEQTTEKIDMLFGYISHNYECQRLDVPDENDFERDTSHTYTVDMGPEYMVTDVTHFGLHFAKGTIPIVSSLQMWKLDNWNVKCNDGSKDYTLVDWDTDKEINDITVIQKTENRLHEADVNCGHEVSVSVTTSKDIFAGTDGEVSLCYYVYRYTSD